MRCPLCAARLARYPSGMADYCRACGYKGASAPANKRADPGATKDPRRDPPEKGRGR